MRFVVMAVMGGLAVTAGLLAWSAPDRDSKTSQTPVQTAAGGPAPADALVATAVKQAKTDGKVVLIEFGASWCVWCTRFQALIHEPEVAPIVTRNFVVLTLTVEERDDKKALENPGGATLKTDWGGAKSGLPFYVFLDGTGKKIGDSNAMADGTNIGFPATPEEITRFVSLVERTAPSFSATDRGVFRQHLKPISQ